MAQPTTGPSFQPTAISLPTARTNWATAIPFLQARMSAAFQSALTYARNDGASVVIGFLASVTSSVFGEVGHTFAIICIWLLNAMKIFKTMTDKTNMAEEGEANVSEAYIKTGLFLTLFMVIIAMAEAYYQIQMWADGAKYEFKVEMVRYWAAAGASMLIDYMYPLQHEGANKNQ